MRKIKRIIFFLSLKFLRDIRANFEPFNLSMTKYIMATKKDFSTSEVTSTQEALIPSNHKGSDGVAFLLTRHKLNGQNYLQWSHAVMMFVCGRGKNDYLTNVVP